MSPDTDVGEWAAWSLATSQFGIDFAVGDRDWLCLGLSGPAPTVGWQRKWKRTDLKIRLASMIMVSSLEVQLGWRPKGAEG